MLLPYLQTLQYTLLRNRLLSALEAALVHLLLYKTMNASHQHYYGSQVVEVNQLPLLAGRVRGLKRE
jgi:hypothetical protein